MTWSDFDGAVEDEWSGEDHTRLQRYGAAQTARPELRQRTIATLQMHGLLRPRAAVLSRTRLLMAASVIAVAGVAGFIVARRVALEGVGPHAPGVVARANDSHRNAAPVIERHVAWY